MQPRQLKAANLADQFSFSELRVSHEQNLVLADVRQDQLVKLWKQQKKLVSPAPTLGLLTT